MSNVDPNSNTKGFMADKERQNKRRDENRDPISGERGAHPVGTGAGGVAGAAGGVAAGAAAGAATGTATGGPVGAAIGGVAGAVGGALAGKAIAEKVNPTAEEAYWREHYEQEPYYDRNLSYEDYQGAYRTGYEGYGKWGGSGKRFEEIEPELRRSYEQSHGKSGLPWDRARHASRAAWNRVSRDLSRYIGYDVVDRHDSKIGTLECLWSDHTGEPAFIGVRTGWIFGKTHVVPAQSVGANERDRKIRLPYDKEKVKDAPAYDADCEMDEAREWEVYTYYGVTSRAERPSRPRRTTPETTAPQPKAAPAERTIELSEEELKVGKREIEAGGVRLRKIIRTEVINQPVELKREEIVIERVPADQAHAIQQRAFEGEEIYIPLRREEVVIEKQPRIREEVRIRKETQTERQELSEEVRREDVEIEEQGEARRSGGNRPAPAKEIREREEIPRSQRRRDK